MYRAEQRNENKAPWNVTGLQINPKNFTGLNPIMWEQFMLLIVVMILAFSLQTNFDAETMRDFSYFTGIQIS